MADLKTTRLALFVDASADPDIIVDALDAVADIDYAADIVIDTLYLIADMEIGQAWADVAGSTDEFTYELVSNVDGEIIEDTWEPIERFFAYRSDLLALYDAVFAHKVPAAHDPYYDINDDGRVDAIDTVLVNNHYYNQEIVKFLRVENPWEDVFYTDQRISAEFANTWEQSDEFGSSIQRISFADQASFTELWSIPGSVEVTVDNVFTQTDLFTPAKDINTFSDQMNFVETYDPSFPSMVREWSDNFSQSDSFDSTNLSDTWVQVDAWTLGETEVTLENHWDQTAKITAPYHLALGETWTQTQAFTTNIVTQPWQDAWTLASSFTATYHNVVIQDAWAQTDTFQGPTPLQPLTDDWAQDPQLSANIHTVHLVDEWVQISDHHSMTSQVGIWQLAVPMLSWYSEDVDPIRHLADTFNWSERWSVDLPTEAWAETQTPVDEFEANPFFFEQGDAWSPTEDWAQVAGIPLNDIFDQTQEFTLLHDAILTFHDTQTWTEQYGWEQKTIACPVVPHATFTLGDLVLRNPQWGNKITLEQARTIGATRSGAPFVGRQDYWPERTVYHYTIRHLSDEEFDAILDFMDQTLGLEIRWSDHYGVQHRGFCLEPAGPVRRRSRNRGEIELILADIGDPTGTFSDCLDLEGVFEYA